MAILVDTQAIGSAGSIAHQQVEVTVVVVVAQVQTRRPFALVQNVGMTCRQGAIHILIEEDFAIIGLAERNEVEVAVIVNITWRNIYYIHKSKTIMPGRSLCQRAIVVVKKRDAVSIGSNEQIQVTVAVDITPEQVVCIINLCNVYGCPGEILHQRAIVVAKQAAVGRKRSEVRQVIYSQNQVQVAIAVIVAPGHCARVVALVLRSFPEALQGAVVVAIEPTGCACIVGIGNREVQVAVAVIVAPGHIAGGFKLF